VNGVEGMLYMSSQSTTDGQMTLTITFRLGTDLNDAQVLVQNRVAVAEPRLPDEVRRIGVTTVKASPDLLMVVHLLSPDQRYDQLYIGNYALIRVRDVLARLDGVGDVNLFGRAIQCACGRPRALRANMTASTCWRSASRTCRSPRGASGSRRRRRASPSSTP
jgi:multidrug efflux pump subunit AcrB